MSEHGEELAGDSGLEREVEAGNSVRIMNTEGIISCDPGSGHHGRGTKGQDCLPPFGTPTLGEWREGSSKQVERS